jgi:hypothetical protein
MNNGHTNIAQDAVGGVIPQKLIETLPRVLDGVHLEEMVFAAVSRKLELRTDTIARAAGLRLDDRRLDSSEISLEI